MHLLSPCQSQFSLSEQVHTGRARSYVLCSLGASRDVRFMLHAGTEWLWGLTPGYEALHFLITTSRFSAGENQCTSIKVSGVFRVDHSRERGPRLETGARVGTDEMPFCCKG